MSDDFDFGFSAVSTEEFQKTQTTTEVQPSAVSSDEFDELKKKMDSISSLIQALGDKEDTSLFDETGEKISRLEEKVDKILEIESTQIANALGEQSNSIRAVIDEVEERKGELNEKFGLYVERDFHVVSQLPDNRFLDLINNRNMVIKTDNNRRTQRWYFHQQSRTIRTRYNNQSIEIHNSGKGTHMQVWSTNSNWW